MDKALALVEQIIPTMKHVEEGWLNWVGLKRRLLSYKKANPNDRPLLAHGVRNAAWRLLGVMTAVSDTFLKSLPASAKEPPNLRSLRMALSNQMESVLVSGNLGEATQLMHQYELNVNALRMSAPLFMLVRRYHPHDLELNLFAAAVGAYVDIWAMEELKPLAEKTSKSDAWKPVLKAFCNPTMLGYKSSIFKLCASQPIMDLFFDLGFRPEGTLSTLNTEIVRGDPGYIYLPALAFNGVEESELEKSALTLLDPRIKSAICIRNDFFAKRNHFTATCCQQIFPNVVVSIIMGYSLIGLEDVSFEARQNDETAVTLFKDMRKFCYLALEARGLDFTQDQWEI